MMADEVSEQGYHNKIVDIQEIVTPSGSNFVITCEQDEPVCNYAPETYQESLDKNIYRFFMPMTTLSEGIASDLEVQEFDGGVELVMYAKDVHKVISGNRILITVSNL